MADCIYNSRVTKLDFQMYNWPKKWYSTVVKFTEKMCNEQKRMKNQFSDFIFWVIVDFVHKIHRKNWPILSTKMTISQKLKIANIRKSVYHSLQHIYAFRNIRIAAHSFRLKILYPKKIGGQLHLPHPPPRLRPRTPHVFGLRTLVLLVIVSKSPVHC